MRSQKCVDFTNEFASRVGREPDAIGPNMGSNGSNDSFGCDYDRRSTAKRVNAMSTRVLLFGAIFVGENGSMSGVVGMENARDQRLGV